MVRRREEEESNSLSWYDRPLYDTDDEESDLFRDVEADMEAAQERHKPRRSRETGLIGGCFSVLLTAITSIIVFAVLGVGIVLGGRALGFLPGSDGSAVTMPASGQSENVALEGANRCDPQVWWSAQQANFDAFTTLYDRVSLAPSSEPLDTLVTQMQAQRDMTLTEPDEPCLPSVREPFTQGMDSAITAVQALIASDRTGAALLARTASTALSNTLTALWELGVATDPNTPPNLNVARNACDPAQLEVWYTPFRQQWEQANPLIAQMDVTASPESVQGTLAALDAIRGALIETPAPECADRARQLTIIALNSYINAVNATLQGNLDAARESASTYARSRVALNAWLLWLGVETV
jgi:hypothetical protein